jgi:hypothetical protein
MRKRKPNYNELVAENKKQLLKDEKELEKIYKKIESRNTKKVG